MSSVLGNHIKLKTNFKKIVEVFVYHEYYINKNCNSIKYIPDTESRKMIRNYDLIFRQTSQGFVLLQNIDTKTTSPSFMGPVTFRFNMVFTDNLFLNLTNIPFQYNQFISFSNENFEEDRLHHDIYVGEKDIKLCDADGISGKINLTLNKKNEFFGAENQTYTQYKYKAFFDSRTFRLRYNFYFSKIGGDIRKFYVKNEKDGKRYDNFTSRKLENGMDVYSIELSEEIKLRERFEFLFYLKKEDEFDKSFSKFLSHPEPKNLSFDAERNLFTIDLFNPLD